jgi:predicted Fe-Mo cluster-binding NifX family protein
MVCVETIMKIAIPIFQSRVSPVFDWSRRLMVIEMDQTGEIHREERSLEGATHRDRMDRLVEMGVDVLLCGGISAPMLSLVKANNIRVIPWVAGDVDEVLGVFLEGRISDSKYAMPGCCRRRQRRGNKCRGRGGRSGGPKR